MECTQRLECTQDLYDTHTERICPEQIGFLGILGAKHPVLKGPNKIGRDPQTCQIVLNMSSVSRQHAVINVLNSREFMLMDLDSANKTKLMNKTLQAYIPHPLNNGDTVQFGDIFGIFRLLEENDDLPMTQALDNVPETPAPNRYLSKLNKAPTTMIPESPDVSDKEDSFITPTQLKSEKSKLSNSQFIKPFGKTISIHSMSSMKTDHNNSLNRSSTSSFKENRNTSINDSFISLNCDKNVTSIHEMDTQQPYSEPEANVSRDSIYTADTQIPPEAASSPSIHSLDTQVPTVEHLPQVCKINGQQEMQFDIYAANKENDLSIFNAETQPFVYEKNDLVDSKTNIETKSNVIKNMSLDKSSTSVNKDKVNTSEEELLFDEIDDECLEDFNSQALLPAELPFEENDRKTKENSPILPNRTPKKQTPNKDESDDNFDIMPTQKISELAVDNQAIKNTKINEFNSAKRGARIKSDSSTDCEDLDIPPTQKVEELPAETATAAKIVKRINSDSSTDCEDIDTIPPQNVVKNVCNKDDDVTDCEDDVIEIDAKKSNADIPFEDMATQVIAIEDMNTQIIDNAPSNLNKPALEDMPTQVIDVDPTKTDIPAFEDMATQIIDVDENAANKSDVDLEDQPTQVIVEAVPNINQQNKSLNESSSPFKVPQSTKRMKKDVTKVSPVHNVGNKSTDDVDNYYNATQDIYDDLCSQRAASPEIIKISPMKLKVTDIPNEDDDVVPCSVEDYKVGDRFANIEKDLSPIRNKIDQPLNKNISNISNSEVKEVIGVTTLKKMPSDSSDVESTPKKVRPFFFSDSDLPNSQEIKTSMMIHSKTSVTDSSSDSEPEQLSEDQQTPFLHRVKKQKPVAKIDLTKKFEVEKLPERVITRKRKPTAKVIENRDITNNILKPKFLTEQDDQVDSDIITENIKRLKNYEKAKNGKDIKKDVTINEEKKDHLSTTKIENTKKENNDDTLKKKTDSKTINAKDKEKIKVKIGRPKKETKSKNESKNKEEEKKSTRNRREKENSKTKEDKESSQTTEEKDISSRRSTRNRKKVNDNNTDKKSISPERSTKIKKSISPDRSKKDKKSISPDRSNKEPESKSKQSNKKEDKSKSKPQEEVKSKSPEVEIRRSRRQQTAKEKDKSVEIDKDDSQTMQAPKSILKKSLHEQSTVYNVSSSSADSPKGVKRSLMDDNDVPSPKRSRAYVNNTINSSTSNITNASLRATPVRVMKTHHVLFTAFPSEEVKQKLEKLGAVIVTDVVACSVVLTMAVKRTFKLLCAMGLGRPIVGPSWVQACVDSHMVVDPWLHLIKDEAAEKRFQFNLERTLNGKRNFLKGYNVSSTASVQPNATEMKLIVECSGGTWKEGGSNWVCVTSTKDKSLWPALKKRGATLVSTEFILGGVLRQKIEITSNEFK